MPPVNAPEPAMRRAISWRERDGLRGPLELLVLAACSALVAWPILEAAWLPFVDYPEHLGTIAALHGASDPRFSPYFVVDYPRTQYLLFYFVGDLLAYPFGIEGAGRATVVLSVASLPWAVALWLREHGRPMVLGALASGVALHVFVFWGFLNYAMGMSLGVLALAALARLVRRPDGVTAVVLALAALATFYAHAQLFAWFGLMAIVQTAAALPAAGWARLGRAVAWGLLAAVPSVVGVLVWLRNSGVIERGVAGTRNGSAAALANAPPSFSPVRQTVEQWLAHSFGSYTDGAGTHLAVAFFAVALLFAAVRGTGRRGPWTARTTLPTAPWRTRAPLAAPLPSIGPELVALGTFALYLFAPHSYRNIEPINLRFFPLALALLPALGPRAAIGGGVRALVSAACLALALFGASVHREHFRQTDVEMGDLAPALAAIPPGERVMGLIFDRESRVVPLPTYLHSHQYYQAHVGGLACFGFVEFPISPIQYRPGAEPPPFQPRFEWTPESYDHATYEGSFTFWLVRHREGGRPARSIFRTGTAPEAVYEGRRWTVYRRAASVAAP
jgi:hypothetical protein